MYAIHHSTCHRVLWWHSSLQYTTQHATEWCGDTHHCSTPLNTPQSGVVSLITTVHHSTCHRVVWWHSSLQYTTQHATECCGDTHHYSTPLNMPQSGVVTLIIAVHHSTRTMLSFKSLPPPPPLPPIRTLRDTLFYSIDSTTRHIFLPAFMTFLSE